MHDNREEKSICTDCNVEKTATAAVQAALPSGTCQGLNKLHYHWVKKTGY